MPPFYDGLAKLLLEVAGRGLLEGGYLDFAQAKVIYKDLMSTPPPPKVEFKVLDIPWWLAWGRLAISHLPAKAVDVAFMALHNVLPLGVRKHRLGLQPSPNCRLCGEVEDILHFFVLCPRVEDAWAFLATRVGVTLGGPVPDKRILLLAWPPSGEDLHIALAVCTFMEWVWEGREGGGDLVLEEWVARVGSRAGGHFRSILT